MKQNSKGSKYQPALQWILAFIGFALIIFSGKLSPYIVYGKYDVVSLIIVIGIGLLFMAPLVIFILRERKRKS